MKRQIILFLRDKGGKSENVNEKGEMAELRTTVNGEN